MHIEFENFNIEAFNTTQGNDLFSLIDKNRSRLEDFFAGTVAKTRTLSDTLAYCKVIENRVEEKIYFPYMIVDKNSGDFIGLVDVKNIDWTTQKAEIGYLIDSDFEGKGIISKALGAVVEYLIQKYHFKKLLCRISSENKGSIAVALKNKFILYKTVENDYKTTKGEFVDLSYYIKTF